ncbi:MAG: branched-chain amino acid transaminase [Chloroflexi bacterium]|nr:MAG: branched-chain amino acid aminotransferase [Chloroflexi bacterium OLB13]MBC6955316.1 branched-chain amino acid transaminase [Chloroflexota bacterium]MBV6435906.1 Branched-chain-amino-acid aminotransferase [Anaerolineae bacterium]MDL1915163.1 branched-chain amino acid transaminase [Anaerolineae bacterium CFX4]OQY80715.1 MAG: branched chain amino acid aminotransferase [Anaerolineae bacterium UTCFX5]
MNFGTYAWRNGEWVAFEDCTVHVTTHALHYGSSVFEGIRAYSTPQGPAVFRLQPHTKRMVNSCKLAKIDLPYSADQINSAILETIRRNGHDSCYVRPLAFRGQGAMGLEGRKNSTDLVILTMEWGRYLGSDAIENGVDVQISSWRRMAPGTASSWGKIGGQYINSQFISMEAHDNGFHEGLALDINGYVSEGAGENVFVVVDGVVITPGSWASILLGVTRDSAITLLKEMGVEVRFEPIPRDMLYLADEVFFTGTAAEITPVRSIDRIPVGSGTRGPITKAVQDRFFGITSGAVEDKYGWLSYVNK